MNREIKFNHWLFSGLILEVLILGYSYFSFTENGEVFRHAARYSGRLSLFIYLFCFYLFTSTYYDQTATGFHNIKKSVSIFCILHFIHLGFLSLSVYLNNVPLIPYKLLGGFLAYLMILIYPLIIDRLKKNTAVHLIYFYYVGIVMALTYVARIKGEFEGAPTAPFHYFGLTAVLLGFIGFTGLFLVKRKQLRNTNSKFSDGY